MRSTVSHLNQFIFFLTCFACLQSNAQTQWEGNYVGLLYSSTRYIETGNTVQTDGSIGSNSTLDSARINNESNGLGAFGGTRIQLDSGIVLGLEVDLTQPNQKKSTATLANGGQPNATHEYNVPWMITSRATAGFIVDNLLIYGTGGLAFANEEIRRTQYKINTAPYTEPVFTETDSKNHIGYALGLGAEWRFNKKWSLKVEYLDVRFPEATFRFPDARGGAGGSFNTVQGRVATNTMQIETSRIGLAYSFY